MSTEYKPGNNQIAVRYSRVLKLPWAIALGSGVTVGLGVFVLLSLILSTAGNNSVKTYGLLALVFLPIALTLAERGTAWSDASGLSRLGPPGADPWRLFANFWLGLGGMICLAGLLSWGVAIHIERLLARLFTLPINETYLAIGALVLVAWYRSILDRENLRASTRVIMASLPILAVLLGWGWFLGKTSVPMARMALRSPTNIVQGVAILGGVLWGLDLILSRRNQMSRPGRNMLPALIGALLVGSLSGMGAAFVTLKFTGGATGDPLILATIARSSGATAEMVFLFLGLLMCLAALDWTLTRGQRLVIDAMQEGFVPRFIGLNSSRLSIATGPLLMITLLTTLALVFIPFNYLANVTALVYFVFFSILIIPDILPGNITLPGDRPLKLPFHPLIPALAVVISIYFSLALGVNPWLMLGVWALTGGFYYLVYARQAAIDTRKQEHVIADLEHIEKDYRILVEVTGRGQLATLLQVGQKLAQSRDGQLLVLRVVVQPEQIPVDRWLTGQAYKSLKSQVQELTGENAQVDTIVRVAPTRSEGILETVREEGIDLVIVNWSTVTVGNETRLDPEIDEVVQHAPCDVGVLRGKLPDQLENITVSTAGGPHASQALQYGVALSAAGDGNVTALNIVLGEFNSDKESQAAERLHKAVLETGAQDKFSERIAPAQDIREGIVSESSDADLLLMGASTRGMLDAAVFAGIPFSVAQSRPKATLLIKHYEGARQFWLRQAWEYVYKPFPNLTVSERAEVTGSIQDSAIAGVDYYVMITLSSVIAVLGLITNSAAVIIGAMLVAPLMSPILVMAHSIVLGDVRVMTKGAESTLKGIVAAIVVSAGIALIIPTQPLTSELLARTQPNLFDLVVALASGAAAAYAISRKHLAAALPGVAIAAALVPPLTVVGIGLGYSMYSVAGGAMLLFITNLSAIVLSAAIVFLVLGFRPTMAERGQYMQRWILASIAILLVIAIPLGVASVNLGTRLDRQQAVQEVLEEIISRELAEIEDVTIEPQGSGYLVVGTVYTYGEITTEEIEIIQAQLSQAVGAPVSLRLRIVPARLEEVRP